MAKMIIQLFDYWKLSAKESLILLGAFPHDQITLDHYRQGGSLAPNRDLVERVAHLISINDLLTQLFPVEKDICGEWMTAPNKKFSGQSPVELIDSAGFIGLLMIQDYLESVTIR